MKPTLVVLDTARTHTRIHLIEGLSVDLHLRSPDWGEETSLILLVTVDRGQLIVRPFAGLPLLETSIEDLEGHLDVQGRLYIYPVTRQPPALHREGEIWVFVDSS